VPAISSPSDPTEKGKKVCVEILGPRTSDCLGTMLDDVSVCNRQEGLHQALTNLVINSSWATAADGIFSKSFQNSKDQNLNGKRTDITQRFQGGNITFNNFTCTDEQLVTALLNELKLRGSDVYKLGKPSDVDKPDNPLVLISEWDTTYGRDLPLTLIAKINQQVDGGVASGLLTHEQLLSATNQRDKKNNPGIICLSYMLGMDGQTAAQSTVINSGDSTATSIEEKPEGTSQLDSLRRNAKDLGWELRHDEPWSNKKDPMAIGILGADVYDKLLILQEFRQEFPDSIFFTTDLDARFLEPSERGWARNLVVASSFNLALNATLQGGFAPFRDTYQTGLFLAARYALGDNTLPITCKDVTNWTPFCFIDSSTAQRVRSHT
jgi:hypothetical protein